MAESGNCKRPLQVQVRICLDQNCLILLFLAYICSCRKSGTLTCVCANKMPF